MQRELMPRPRTEQLIVEQQGDETLVYDLISHRAHCLNPVASKIWSQCDGRRSLNEVADVVHRDTGLPADAEIVRLALRQLEKADLLEKVPLPEAVAFASRRQVMKRLGLAGGIVALLPVVASIISPTPVDAFTGGGSGAPCLSGLECRSGICDNVVLGTPPTPGTCR